MKYLLLIYADQQAEQNATPEQQQEIFEAYGAFTQGIQQQGILVGGEALQPTTTATTVRVRDGQTLTTDGPFAETKEQLGGYYMIDCDNLDTAIETAAAIPGAQYGSIEIRPVWVIEK